MKKGLSLLMLVLSFSAFADKVELSQKSRIYERDSDHHSIDLDKLVKLNTGTYIEVDTEDRVYNIEYGDLYRVRHVYDVDTLSSKKRRRRAKRINDQTESGEGKFYIKESDVTRSQLHSETSYYETRVVDTSAYGYDRNEFTSCYSNPVARIRYLNLRQARRGRNKKLIGLGAILAGSIVGAVTDSDAGDIAEGALKLGGLGIYAYGAVELELAREVIYYENGYNCRSFYQEDHRVYEFYNEGRRCETRRYYSNRWNGTHEYFKTSCRGRKYMSFERRYETWGY